MILLLRMAALGMSCSHITKREKTFNYSIQTNEFPSSNCNASFFLPLRYFTFPETSRTGPLLTAVSKCRKKFVLLQCLIKSVINYRCFNKHIYLGTVINYLWLGQATKRNVLLSKNDADPTIKNCRKTISTKTRI